MESNFCRYCGGDGFYESMSTEHNPEPTHHECYQCYPNGIERSTRGTRNDRSNKQALEAAVRAFEDAFFSQQIGLLPKLVGIKTNH